MTGRLVLVPDGWQLRPSGTATSADFAAWVKQGGPPPPTAAEIDALVTDMVIKHYIAGKFDADWKGRSEVDGIRQGLQAALRELLGMA